MPSIAIAVVILILVAGCGADPDPDSDGAPPTAAPATPAASASPVATPTPEAQPTALPTPTVPPEPTAGPTGAPSPTPLSSAGPAATTDQASTPVALGPANAQCPPVHDISCDGYISDPDGALDDRDGLEATATELVKTHGHEVAIVLVAGAPVDIGRFAIDIGEGWVVKERDGVSGGVVVAIDTVADNGWITAGPTLQGVIPDASTLFALAGPSFEADDWDSGVATILGAIGQAFAEEQRASIVLFEEDERLVELVNPVTVGATTRYEVRWRDGERSGVEESQFPESLATCAADRLRTAGFDDFDAETTARFVDTGEEPSFQLPRSAIEAVLACGGDDELVRGLLIGVPRFVDGDCFEANALRDDAAVLFAISANDATDDELLTAEPLLGECIAFHPQLSGIVSADGVDCVRDAQPRLATSLLSRDAEQFEAAFLELLEGCLTPEELAAVTPG